MIHASRHSTTFFSHSIALPTTSLLWIATVSACTPLSRCTPTRCQGSGEATADARNLRSTNWLQEKTSFCSSSLTSKMPSCVMTKLSAILVLLPKGAILKRRFPLQRCVWL